MVMPKYRARLPRGAGQATHSFFFFFNKFIYFWLHWVFVSARGLFSSCGERGLLFVVVCNASVVVAHGLSSCGSQDIEHRLSSCGAQA